MKVAVCYSGHLRTIKDCYNSHARFLLEKFNPDVYLHSWDNIEATTNSWHSLHMTNRIVDDKMLSFIEHNLAPKDILIEKQIDFNLQGNQSGASISLNGLKNMTYSMFSAFMLSQKNNIEYDFIIKIRPDLLLKTDFINIYSEHSLQMFGNKKSTKVLYKGVDIDYGALDCLFIAKEGTSAVDAFKIFNNFDMFYRKDRFFHSPFVDFLIHKKINFSTNKEVSYNNDWAIKRG